MRTYVYVDGFNLYYGAVRGTPFKWLDLKAAMERVLPGHLSIERIKYFTSLVDGKRDPGQPMRQQTYLRALQAHIPEIKIYYGHFKTRNVPMPRASNPSSSVGVKKTEEKGTDVNLAVHLLNDSWRDRYECAVVVSNDSDRERVTQARDVCSKTIQVYLA